MIKRLEEAINGNLRGIHLNEEDVTIQKFPRNGVKNLKSKIITSVEDILNMVEIGQMIYINPRDLKKILPKMKEKEWRKHNRNRQIKGINEIETNQISFQVREDLSLWNFKKGKVEGMNFYLGDEEGENDSIVASVYNIGGERKILLRKDIAEHPIFARTFLALVLNKYRDVK